MSEEVDLVVSFSMNSLRTALTRRPLLWFFTLTLVPAVRDLVRPLVAWRLPWRRYAFALLAWPALAVVVVAAARLLALRDHSAVASLPPSLTRERADLILRASLGELLLVVPWIVGWYGFAARRLLARYSPLAVALLLGTLLAIAFLLPDLQFVGSQANDVAQDLAGTLPLAVVSLWLYGRSPRSLLPLVLLQSTAPVSALVVFFWGGP